MEESSLRMIRGLLIVGGLVLGLPGCGDVEEKLIPVAGKVTLDGTPLTSGSVSFRPSGDSESQEQPTGTISSDGSYRLHLHGREGAPPGRYKVVVFANEPIQRARGGHGGLPRSLIDRRYNSAKTTPLEKVVKDNAPEGAYDLALTR
jgi:hypothetical protein